MTRTRVLLALMAAEALTLAVQAWGWMIALRILVTALWVLTVAFPLLFIGGQTLMKARQKWGRA